MFDNLQRDICVTVRKRENMYVPNRYSIKETVAGDHNILRRFMFCVRICIFCEVEKDPMMKRRRK